MDCGCIYVGSYDASKFYKAGTQIARKEHLCSECGRIINKGELYEKAVGKWDGRLDSFKTCNDCLSVRDNFFCNGFYHEGLWEDLDDHIREYNGDISEDCLSNLTVRAREKVCDIIEYCWERYFDDKGDE